MRKIRLALLLADTPAPTIVEKYGDYCVQFTNLLRNAIDRNKRLRESATLEIKGFDVVHNMELPNDLSQFDAIMITGSGVHSTHFAFPLRSTHDWPFKHSAASAYEDKPWINRLVGFTENVITKHPAVRIVGVCFGHQIVAKAMGGEVIKNPLGWEVSRAPV
jgi:GMP synthase-like glutamine amidotransferase